MKSLANWPACLTVVAVGILAGCSQTVKPPDVAANIRTALDQAGFKKVSVNQDRDKGVVTLGGPSEPMPTRHRRKPWQSRLPAEKWSRTRLRCSRWAPKTMPEP